MKRIELNDEEIINKTYMIDLKEDGDFEVETAEVDKEYGNISLYGKHKECGKNSWKQVRVDVILDDDSILSEDMTITDLIKAGWESYTIDILNK